MFNVLYSVFNSPDGNPFVAAVLICAVMLLITFFSAISHGFERAFKKGFFIGIVIVLIIVPAVFVLTGGMAIFVSYQIVGSCVMLLLSILNGALLGGLLYQPGSKEAEKQAKENEPALRIDSTSKEVERTDQSASNDEHSITQTSPLAVIAIIVPQIAYLMFLGSSESDTNIDFNITIRSSQGESVSFIDSLGCDHIRRINSEGYDTLKYSTIAEEEGATWQLYGLNCNRILRPETASDYRYEALKVSNQISAELYLIFDRSPHQLVSANYESSPTDFPEEAEIEPTEFYFDGPFFYRRISLAEVPPQLSALSYPTLLRGESMLCGDPNESSIPRSDYGEEMQSYLATDNIASYSVGQLEFNQELGTWEIGNALNWNLPLSVLQIENPVRDIFSEEPPPEYCLLLDVGGDTIRVNTENLERIHNLHFYLPEDETILSIKKEQRGRLYNIMAPRFSQWRECSGDLIRDNMEPRKYYVNGDQAIKIEEGEFMCRRISFLNLPI